jgi:glycosyltransferase involved in cell wall biosynthesis
VVSGLLRHHQVDVLTIRRHDQAHVERVRSARVLRVPLPDADEHTQVESFQRALRRQLEGADYDIVHFRDGWSGLTVLDLQRRQRYATVFDVARSPMAESAPADLTTATELERAEEACARRADLVLAPTEPARQFLAGLTEESKVHVVPPGVNVDAFDWDEPARSGPPMILFLGALAPRRGVRVLLRAMYDVLTVTDAVLVLAGYAEPAFRESLEQGISDLNLEGRVRLLGEIPHEVAPFVISRSTICVAPGAAELAPRATALYPTKLLEYMACQRAVIAPERSTVSMLVHNLEHALLFEPGSPEDLARKIVRLLQDRPLRDRMARAGYELVRRSHSASATRRALRQAYQWLQQQDSWRERLVASSQKLAPGEIELHVPSGDATLSRDSNFEGDTAPIEESGLALLEQEEVTRIQPNPLAADQAAASRRDGTDAWVIGESSALVEDELFAEGGSTGTVVVPPLDNASVVGELEVGKARPDLAEPLAAVAAVMAPLGGGTRNRVKAVRSEGSDKVQVEEPVRLDADDEQPTQIVPLESMEVLGAGSEARAATAPDEPDEELMATRLHPQNQDTGTFSRVPSRPGPAERETGGDS